MNASTGAMNHMGPGEARTHQLPVETHFPTAEAGGRSRTPQLHRARIPVQSATTRAPVPSSSCKHPGDGQRPRPSRDAEHYHPRFIETRANSSKILAPGLAQNRCENIAVDRIADEAFTDSLRKHESQLSVDNFLVLPHQGDQSCVIG